MEVTDPGMNKLVKLWQARKAISPMVVTELPRFKLVRASQ
jgi:hypothetical protein